MTEAGTSNSSMAGTVANYGLLLLLGAIFASNFVMTKVSVAELPPLLVVSIRIGVAVIVLFIAMRLAKLWFPRGQVWLAIVGSALFGHTLPFTLIAWGQQRVDAGLAAILMATMPLFTLAMAQIFTKDEKPNRFAFLGFAVALVGIVILFGPEKLLSLADQSVRQYALVGAAMCYGVNAIITKSLAHIPWQQTTTSFMLVAFLLSLPSLMFVDLTTVSASSEVWLATIYTGLFPTALGSILVIIIVKQTSASFLSQINFLVPLYGVAFAILFANESLPANGALALIIILAGVALARRRPKRELISINKGV